jgi:exosortase
MIEFRRLPLVAFLSLGVLWFLLCQHLSVHWNVNPQYVFGWWVPALCVFLLWRRCGDAPRPDRVVARPFWLLIIVLGAVAFLPVWMIEQPNPDWRLVSWAFGAIVVAISIAMLALLGGWAWVKHFGFPVAFILTAIPWPTDLELLVVQNLMLLVAGITVEALNFLGVAAVQQGNVIEISKGLLGIDDACSGVRSLQATFMISLFLGEFYRLRILKRLGLLVAGIVLALLCNIVRAFLLAWLASQDGLETIGKWHDPAGYTILTVCFLGVWLLALLLVPETQAKHRTPVQIPNAFPRFAGLALGLWIIAVIGGAEFWYRQHDRAQKVRWSFVPPTDREKFHVVEITKPVRDLLQYDEGTAAAWRESDGTTWMAYFFKWKAGPARSRILARSHRPDICLPASGFQLTDDHGTHPIAAGDLQIPFAGYTFRDKMERPVHVYFCLWEERAGGVQRTGAEEGWGRSAYLQSVVRGERNLGQTVLELVVFGYNTEPEARAAISRRLPSLIQSL